MLMVFVDEPSGQTSICVATDASQLARVSAQCPSEAWDGHEVLLYKSNARSKERIFPSSKCTNHNQICSTLEKRSMSIDTIYIHITKKMHTRTNTQTQTHFHQAVLLASLLSVEDQQKWRALDSNPGDQLSSAHFPGDLLARWKFASNLIPRTSESIREEPLPMSCICTHMIFYDIIRYLICYLLFDVIFYSWSGIWYDMLLVWIILYYIILYCTILYYIILYYILYYIMLHCMILYHTICLSDMIWYYMILYDTIWYYWYYLILYDIAYMILHIWYVAWYYMMSDTGMTLHDTVLYEMWYDILIIPDMTFCDTCYNITWYRIRVMHDTIWYRMTLFDVVWHDIIWYLIWFCITSDTILYNIWFDIAY